MNSHAIIRPYRESRITVPLHARSVGHFNVSAPWRDSGIVKHFLELYWCVEGKGRFRPCGHDTVLEPGYCCCYFPGDAHEIEALTPRWEYYWVTIDGEEVPFLIERFGLRREPRKAGECPADLFQKLAREIGEIGPAGEYRAGATAYEILTASVIPPHPEDIGPAVRFREMAEEEFDNSVFTVAEAAMRLGIHRSTLARLVTAQYGISPHEYLTSLRLQNALRLLQENTLSIKEIAGECGFPDANYFSKVFAKRFGRAPSSARKGAS